MVNFLRHLVTDHQPYCDAIISLDFLCSATYVRLTAEGAELLPTKAAYSQRARPGDVPMLKNFDEMQKVGKDNMDTAMKSFGSVSKGLQAIASEVAVYSKKSFEDGSAAAEKLFGA